MTKLIQLNVWEGAIGSYLLRFLATQDADILMLQEVNSSPEGETYTFDFLQNVQQRTGLAHVFFSPSRGMTYCGKKVYHGIAILSKLPFLHTHNEFVHLDFNPAYDFAAKPGEPRSLQHATLDMGGGKELHLFNYHGHCMANGIKTGNDLTDGHCRRIAKYVAGLQGPKILAGDFNLAPDSASIAPLNAAYRNLTIEHKIETTRNLFAYTMDTVDYIWVNDGIAVSHFEVMPDLVSDHTALLLEFDV